MSCIKYILFCFMLLGSYTISAMEHSSLRCEETLVEDKISQKINLSSFEPMPRFDFVSHNMLTPEARDLNNYLEHEQSAITAHVLQDLGISPRKFKASKRQALNNFLLDARITEANLKPLKGSLQKFLKSKLKTLNADRIRLKHDTGSMKSYNNDIGIDPTHYSSAYTNPINFSFLSLSPKRKYADKEQMPQLKKQCRNSKNVCQLSIKSHLIKNTNENIIRSLLDGYFAITLSDKSADAGKKSWESAIVDLKHELGHKHYQHHARQYALDIGSEQQHKEMSPVLLTKLKHCKELQADIYAMGESMADTILYIYSLIEDMGSNIVDVFGLPAIDDYMKCEDPQKLNNFYNTFMQRVGCVDSPTHPSYVGRLTVACNLLKASHFKDQVKEQTKNKQNELLEQYSKFCNEEGYILSDGNNISDIINAD